MCLKKCKKQTVKDGAEEPECVSQDGSETPETAGLVPDTKTPSAAHTEAQESEHPVGRTQSAAQPVPEGSSGISEFMY